MARFAELWVNGDKEKAPETLLDLLLHASETHHLSPSPPSSPSTPEHKSFAFLEENGVIAQSITYQKKKKRRKISFMH
jgi:hypothetical protein